MENWPQNTGDCADDCGTDASKRRLPGEMIIKDLDKGFKMVLYPAVISGILQVSWAINSDEREHVFKFRSGQAAFFLRIHGNGDIGPGR